MYTYNIPSLTKHKNFEKYNYLFVTLRGVFLALILFCASFLVPYIRCNYQHIMRTTPQVRYLVLFLVIYFSINLVDPDLKTIEHPMHAIVRSLFVFFIFIMLNNLPVTTIVTMMVFFALLVLTHKYYNYYAQEDMNRQKNNNGKMDILQIIQWGLVISIIILLLLSMFSSEKSHGSLTLKKCNI